MGGKENATNHLTTILEYTRIDWDTAHRDVEKATIYDDLLGKHDKVWEENNSFTI
jgi:hypothetical protein